MGSHDPHDIERHLSRIASRSVVVSVVGLGYVGLPLALTFAEAGFSVIGVDADAQKIRTLDEGESYIMHVDAQRVRDACTRGKLRVTTDFFTLDEADAIMVTVPIPLDDHREPEMGLLRDAFEAVARRLRSGQLVVLESTTYPGTTDELIRGILESQGLSAERDFYLAYSPEREDPGNGHYLTANIPKLVGGLDDDAQTIAAALYGAVIEKVVKVSSARVAEASKLVENVFRVVNIALVNELKIILDRMGMDVWEVLDAAETKPFGFMRFDPGPGLGGRRIPLDPFFLTYKAREHKIPTRLIELAGEINVSMPQYVMGKIQDALNARHVPLSDSRVLLLGISYKEDIDDPRGSPAFELLDLLRSRGAEVSYHDPHVPRMPVLPSRPNLPQLSSVPLSPDTLATQDAVVIATAHSSLDYDLVRQHAPMIVDTRGVFGVGEANVIRA